MTPAEGIARLINERDAALARAEAAEAAHRAEQRLTASSWRAAQAYVQRIGELEADRDAALARAAAAEARVAELVNDVRRYSSAGAELAERAVAAEARAEAAESALARRTRERDRARMSVYHLPGCPLAEFRDGQCTCGHDRAVSDEEVEP